MAIFHLSPEIVLSEEDKSGNIFIAGINGVGVSEYLLSLIRQDIDEQNPVILFDKHGNLCDEIISSLPGEYLENTAYVDLGNTQYPVGINIFENNDEYGKQEVSDMFINLMYSLYDPGRTGIIGPRFEHAVRNAVLTVTWDENVSFIELLRCLTDSSYVKKILSGVKDPIVLNYWNQQVTQTSDVHKSEVIDYIISKLGIFITDRMLRNMLGQTKSSVEFKTLLSDKKIILFNFNPLKENKAAHTIISTFLMYKLSKEMKSSPDKPKKLNFYLDDAVSWSPGYIGELLTENKRYGVNVILSAPVISDVNPFLKRAFLHAGNLVSFRLHTDDANILAPEFHTSHITAEKICLLDKYSAYMKTLTDGNVKITGSPVRLNIPTSPAIDPEKVGEFKTNSAKKYGMDVNTVEAEIQNRMCVK